MNRKKRPIYKILFIVIFFIIIIILNRQGFFKPAKGFLIRLFTGANQEIREDTINTNNFFTTLFSVDQVIEDNNSLKELELKYQDLKQQKEEILKENESLRKELKLLPRIDFDLVNAEIVGQDIISGGEVLIINKGEEEGIKIGMPVIIQNRIYVGEVYEVFKRRSKIALSVSSLNNIDVTSNKENFIIAAKGSFNLELKSEQIQNNIEIQENDILVTAGVHKKYPVGLIVGKVSRLEDSVNGLSKTAVIQPFYSAKQLKFVSVITGVSQKYEPFKDLPGNEDEKDKDEEEENNEDNNETQNSDEIEEDSETQNNNNQAETSSQESLNDNNNANNTGNE